MKLWSGETQIFHLTQTEYLTKEKQDLYFNNIKKLFIKKIQTNIIFFS